jgi:hypothetical protein
MQPLRSLTRPLAVVLLVVGAVTAGTPVASADDSTSSDSTPTVTKTVPDSTVTPQDSIWG